jgi:hypothetical protein
MYGQALGSLLQTLVASADYILDSLRVAGRRARNSRLLAWSDRPPKAMKIDPSFFVILAGSAGAVKVVGTVDELRPCVCLIRNATRRTDNCALTLCWWGALVVREGA